MFHSFGIPSFLVISCTNKGATCSAFALDDNIRVSIHAPKIENNDFGIYLRNITQISTHDPSQGATII